jgi:predicted tellurium resistance membrane protein TerC
MKTQKPHTLPKYIIYGFFSIGLLSAITFRAIIVFQHVEPTWVRPVWYIAVAGYFLFFMYRFWISQKRKKAIKDYQLIEKVKANACLTDDDREVVLYLLSSIKVSLEDINYAIIFLTSIIAVVADLVLVSMK